MVRLFQPVFQFVHVAVGEAVAPRLAEPDAVDDGGVIEAVRDDGILLPEQRLEDAAIGVEAGGEQDGVVLAEIARDPLLEPAVQRLGAADETHRRHAEAEGVEPGLGGRDDLGMVGEAEIVVGAEIDDLAPRSPRGDLDPRSLRTGDQPLALSEAVGLDLRKQALEMAEKIFRHTAPSKSDMVDIPLYWN